jgi:hypothetical protein
MTATDAELIEAPLRVPEKFALILDRHARRTSSATSVSRSPTTCSRVEHVAFLALSCPSVLHTNTSRWRGRALTGAGLVL